MATIAYRYNARFSVPLYLSNMIQSIQLIKSTLKVSKYFKTHGTVTTALATRHCYGIYEYETNMTKALQCSAFSGFQISVNS